MEFRVRVNIRVRVKVKAEGWGLGSRWGIGTLGPFLTTFWKYSSMPKSLKSVGLGLGLGLA